MKTFLRFLMGAAVGAILGCVFFFIGWIVMYARYADGPRFSQRDAGMVLGFIFFIGGAAACIGATVIGAIAALAGRVLVGTLLGLVAACAVLAYAFSQFGNDPIFVIPAVATSVSWLVTGIIAAFIGRQ